MDKRQRDNTNAPSGIKEGLLRGGENLATGIFGGITGIVTKPVQGTSLSSDKKFSNVLFQVLKKKVSEDFSKEWEKVSLVWSPDQLLVW